MRAGDLALQGDGLLLPVPGTRDGHHRGDRTVGRVQAQLERAGPCAGGVESYGEVLSADVRLAEGHPVAGAEDPGGRRASLHPSSARGLLGLERRGCVGPVAVQPDVVDDPGRGPARGERDPYVAGGGLPGNHRVLGEGAAGHPRERFAPVRAVAADGDREAVRLSPGVAARVEGEPVEGLALAEVDGQGLAGGLRGGARPAGVDVAVHGGGGVGAVARGGGPVAVPHPCRQPGRSQPVDQMGAPYS